MVDNPPGYRSAGASTGFQIPGEGLDVGAAYANRATDSGPVPAGELALVQHVRLAGQAAVSGQEPGKSDPFSVVKAAWIAWGSSWGAAVAIGHFPAGAGTGTLGQSQPQQFNGNPT
jgi:hypothetical protein